eukprot:267518-Amphidinium_carterae.1
MRVHESALLWLRAKWVLKSIPCNILQWTILLNFSMLRLLISSSFPNGNDQALGFCDAHLLRDVEGLAFRMALSLRYCCIMRRTSSGCVVKDFRHAAVTGR